MRGDGYTYQRGKRWWAGYYRDGALCREPAKLADADGVLRPAKDGREARRFLRSRIKAVLGGRCLGPGQLSPPHLTKRAGRARGGAATAGCRHPPAPAPPA